jgi:hypothetical protein
VGLDGTGSSARAGQSRWVGVVGGAWAVMSSRASAVPERSLGSARGDTRAVMLGGTRGRVGAPDLGR